MHARLRAIVLLMIGLAPVALPQGRSRSNPLAVFARDRVSAPVDNRATVTLTGGVHPVARPENDQGPAPATRALSRMILVLKRDPAQQAALDAFTVAQQDPQSPYYHHWLTNEEFAAHFGVSPHDLDAVVDWLRDQGFTIDAVSPARWNITFSGTVAQVQAAFHTLIRLYREPRTGEIHYANASDPAVPQALSAIIGGIVGLHDFQPKPLARTAPRPDLANGGGSHYLAPSDFARIYNLGPLYNSGIDGTGQTIAIVGRCAIDLNVVQSFRSQVGLPSGNTSILGTSSYNCTTDELGEPYLDVEWAGAVARNANIVLVVATNILDAAGYAVNNNVAPVMSTSFGACEAAEGAYGNLYWGTLWQQASVKGITSLVSSGDAGAAGCDNPHTEQVASQGPGVNALCSSPYSVCVGGTQFDDTANASMYWSPAGSAKSYIPEMAWNESGVNGGSGLWSTGGGFSSIYPRPAWQTGNPGNVRGVPDVSLTAAAHDGYLTCDNPCSNQFSVSFGTSAATPSFAGIMALVVQRTGQPQGAVNSSLYAFATRTDIGTVFHDVTSGNNSVPGQSGYNAGPGWDPVTGLGSVDASALVNAFAATFVPSAALSSKSLSFGNQVLTTKSSPQTVNLSNQGSSALNIASIYLQGSNGSDFPSTTTCLNNGGTGSLTPGSSCIVTVSFQPSMVGLRTASIVITDNASDSPQTISLTGNGTAAAAPPVITGLSPSTINAGSAGFVLTINGSAFATGASVLWNGSTVPSTFVSATQMTASIGATLIAAPGTAAVVVSNDGLSSHSMPFTVTPVSNLSLSNQVMTAQAPLVSGCSRPPSATSFLTTQNTLYLYFEATVTDSDSLSNDWLAPDGSTVSGAVWNANSGMFCFTGARLNVGSLSVNHLGNWQARVYDNGQLVFSVPFTVLQFGSFGQITSEGTWDFRLDAVNLGHSPAQAHFSFFDNNGSPLQLPLASSAGSQVASALDQTLNPNATVILDSAGLASAPALVGWGQMTTNGGITGFGTFSNPTFGWNAVVPLETRNASSYLLAFDNTNSVATGLALANVVSESAGINVIIRDDTGAQIGKSTISLPSQGHTSFLLNQQYPVTANRRGTIEFDTPDGGQISVLGLRANGPALTTLPVLANVSSGGGSITHVAYNGGFSSTFYLVNTGVTSARFTLSFFDNNGNPLMVPLLLPQTGASTTTEAMTYTLAAGAMLVVQTQGQGGLPAVEGSAQLTTGGAISGFEIFQWTTFRQEASVSLETRAPNSFVLVFDDTNGLTTGVALANVTNSPANVTVNLRDNTGALLQTGSVNLAAQGHISFLLPISYPLTANLRGTAEFVVPASGQISVIGLRAKSDGTLTTIPVLPK